MLWFGTGDGTPVFTVFIASFPVVFAGGMQGARTLEQRWRDLSQVFALPWHMRVTDIYLPHVISYLFPAWIVALGSSWRVVVMAELLASSDGVGAALASSRAQLDMPAPWPGSAPSCCCCWRWNICCWSLSSAKSSAGVKRARAGKGWHDGPRVHTRTRA